MPIATKRPVWQAGWQQLEAMILDLAEGMIVFDIDGRFLCKNSAALPLSEAWQPKEVGGNAKDSGFELYGLDGYPLADNEWPQVRVLRGESFTDLEVQVRYRGTNTVRIVRLSGKLLLGSTPLGVLIMRDVTEQKQIEVELERRVRQQNAVAELGLFALGNDDLQMLMDEATRRLAEALEVEYCKVLELQPDGKSLLLKAGIGWREGCIGRATVGTDLSSQAGYTLRSEEPVVVEDLREETRFSGPLLLHDHGVISGLSVMIHGVKKPYGVLGAHTTQKRHFTQDDVNVLQAVANLLCEAIERKRVEEALRASEDQLSRVFHASPAPTAIIRLSDLCYLDANESFLKALEYERDEVVGRTVPELDLLLAEDRQPPDAYQRYLTQSLPPTEVNLHTGSRKGRVFIAAAEPIDLRGEACSLITLLDITERKQSEEELMKAIELVMQDAAWFSRSVVEKLAQLKSRKVDTTSVAELTDRERQVLALIAKGWDNGRIAAELGLAKRTVYNYANRIYDKLGVRSRAQAVVWARERGLIDL